MSDPSFNVGHGTLAGAQQHRRNGDPHDACEPCRTAYNAYYRARSRAAGVLISKYRIEFDGIFADELARANRGE